MNKVTCALAVAVSAVLALPAWAVSTAFFEVNSAEQIRKGKLDATVVVEPGTLALGFDKKEALKADGEVVWSVAVDPTGGIYAATSQKGNLYLIRGDKPSIFHTVDDTALFAVAVGPDGKAYYAGGPSGNVYKDGKVFCKLPQSYVWALLFDDRGGLYAATGPVGKVYRIDATGTSAVVLETPDPHVMCLARDSKGNVYAGTSKSGLVYQIPRAGAAKVIYDAAESEIRCLAVDDHDNLYFGTADVQPGRGASRPVGMRPSSRPAPPPSGGGVSGPAAEEAGVMPSAAPAAVRDEVTATNSVYRMASDGSVVPLYSIRGKMVMSLLSLGANLYVGTGNRGDLLRIDENLDVTTLEDDLEKQVVCLAAGRNGEILMGTGDQGRVIVYAQDYVKDGQYMSEVFDARFAARFGAVTWTGKTPPGTSVEITTQSGNVAEPDASWSEWSKPYAASGAQVTSPVARYIRYKLRLKTVLPKAAPTVDDVRIAYLTSNQPPRVKFVRVMTPDKARGDKPGVPGQVEVLWQAEDPNGDKLQYVLEFRARGDETWRALGDKTDKPSYTWKTETVPDGTYEVRVTASDSPDNAKDAALSHSRISESFVIDNTRPTVTIAVRPGDLKSGKAAADVVLSDAVSIIRSAEYSVDSGEWQAFLPEDRLFDSTTEKATIALEGLKEGEHTIAVRASDACSNVGAGSRTFTVK